MAALSDPAYSYGALLAGGLVAFVLSGMVGTQCIVYFKLYPQDSRIIKSTVFSVWLLDMLHSACIAVSLFFYFITYFGDNAVIDRIPGSIALSILATAIQTLIAHGFFAHKILKSSNNNYFVTTPIIILAVARVGGLLFVWSRLLAKAQVAIQLQQP
ncbi:hypothetical protein PQX77_001528, partial [Marasmius sp. AFHP31]